jgi:hypothetical protein
VESFRQLQKITKTTSDALFQGVFMPGVTDRASPRWEDHK